MLFKRNNRSFQFHLMDLSVSEYKEISRLITENGGEVCTSRNFPIITFAKKNRPDDDKPIFHINYIQECIKHGILFDLMKFKLGDHGTYGCLMSMLIRGENLCPCVVHNDSLCMSKQIKPNSNDESYSTITKKYDDADEDCVIIQEINAGFNMQPILSDVHPTDKNLQESQLIPDEFLSAINATIPKIEECGERRSGDDLIIEIPEVQKFEEVDFEPNTCSNQSQSTMVVDPSEPTPTDLFEDIIYIGKQQGKMRDTEFEATQTSTSADVAQVHSPSLTKENTQVCDYIVVGTEQENAMSTVQLPQAQDSELETINVSKISSLSNLNNTEKKVDHKRKEVEYQPVAGGSRDAVSPTIPMDDTEIEVIDREASRSPRAIEEYCLDLSDDEDVDMSRETVVQSSPKSQRTGSKRKASSENTEIPSPDRTGHVSTVRKNSRAKRQAAKCSMISSDEASTSDDDDWRSSSKTRSRKSSNTGKQSSRNVPTVPKRQIPYSRNYSADEECEMIEYLINTNSIHQAKGIEIWRQVLCHHKLGQRTHQSLNNHFRKFIMPNIHQFTMDPESMRKFKKLRRKNK